MLLSVEGLHAGYGVTEVLSGVSFDVREGEVVAILGPNGAGKTTLMRTLSGLLAPAGGRVSFDGADVTGARPERAVAAGMVHCPEGRQMFPLLSTEANLRLGGYRRRDRHELERDVGAFLDRWPMIGRRRTSPAGQLSGGEQQIVALGRALMARPRLLLLDEPSMGLAPVAVQQMYAAIRDLAAGGQSILLVEQNARQALSVADSVRVLVGGRIVHSGTADSLTPEDVAELYFHRPAAKESAA